MLYVFDGYELDTARQELRQAGVPVRLAPKVHQVLAYLIQHCDRVVFKQELLEQLWPDTYVDDSAVKRCIMAARRRIGISKALFKPLRTPGRVSGLAAPAMPHRGPATLAILCKRSSLLGRAGVYCTLRTLLLCHRQGGQGGQGGRRHHRHMAYSVRRILWDGNLTWWLAPSIRISPKAGLGWHGVTVDPYSDQPDSAL